MRLTLVLATLACTLLLAACSHGSGVPAEPSPPPLDTLVAHTDGAGVTRAWDGTVQAVQQADLAAQTSARVLAVDSDVGDRVERGAILVRLTAVEQDAGANAARAQLRAAQAAADEAEATYARYQSLAQRQLVSRLQFDQIKSTRDAALAARDAARAQLAGASQQADYTSVRAPFAGIVQSRRVEPGEAVAPGRVLLSLYAPGALRVQAQIPESDAQALRAVTSVKVVLADGRHIDSSTLTVFPSADPSTHSVTVRATLPALDRPPPPGTTARLLSGLPGGTPTLWLPRSVIVQRGEVSAVYVIENSWPSLRQIRVGRTDGERVEVLAGVHDGDRVATDPVAALQALVRRHAITDGSHD